MSLLHKQLDDDLVMEILRRVSVEQLWWRCRRVCKKWNALILSPHFAHLPHASPSTFLVSFNNKETEKLDFFYPGKDDAEAFSGSLVEHWKHQMVTGKDVVPVASCKGLVLFNPFMSSDFYIGDPITGELITMKHTIGLSGLVEFFYHSSIKEYKLLRCHRKGYADNLFEYALLTLGSKKWRRLGAFPHRVRYGSLPATLKNTVYWMIDDRFGAPSTCENSIMMFSMDSKEFGTMPHLICQCRSHQRMHLLEMRGQLTCWCLLGEEVQAWGFEGHWTQIYCLDFNQNFSSYLLPQEDNCRVQLVSIQDRQLLLFWCGIGMFRYNLLTNAVEKIELEGIDEPYKGQLLLTPYTKNVVSLNNFYPGLSKIHTHTKCKLRI
ncbi:hypothetical protein V6N13_088063 [Hibiscus sabdariffa]|uniref:F-box domain-containing protein n=1 Tax=Hibiscus sabdariffa TaxID=183260 RepID=A0ABR2FY66_9ROSI